MSNLRKLIRYFCLAYPLKNELSKARLTKMVYLSDWLAAQKHKKTLTNIEWLFDHYGPFVDDVIRDAYDDPYVDVLHTSTFFGNPKILIQAKEGLELPELDETIKSIADQVINDTKPLNFNNFIKYVYNTYPVRTNNRYSALNLVELANAEELEQTNQ